MDVAVEAKKKIAERRRKRRRVEFTCKAILILAIVAIGILIYGVLNYPFKKVYDDGLGRLVLERNLTDNQLFIPKLPEQLPEMAWESDLPGFVEWDLKWLDKQDRGYIIYTFGDFRIEISKMFDSEYEFCIISETWGLTDASIYKKDGKLYIYAVETFSEAFVEYIVSENKIEENVLTLDYEHIPFGICNEENDVSWRLADYAILFKDNIFYFYQDGRILSENPFYDEIEDIYWNYSLVRTTNNMIYGLYAYLDDNGVPRITSKYLDSDMVFKSDFICSDELKLISHEYNPIMNLPIVEKNGEYYTYVPCNWEEYAQYHIDNSKLSFLSELKDSTNLSRKKEKLEDVFFSAEIYPGEYGGWYSDFVFEIAEDKYYKFEEYRIRGYDTFYDYYLSECEIETLINTAAFSIEEYWELVNNIRETYEKYYEKGGE